MLPLDSIVSRNGIALTEAITLIPVAWTLQLASKQWQHYNPAALVALNELLLAVVILTAHFSRLHTFVPAELCCTLCGYSNMSWQTLCATKRASCCTLYALNKQLLWSLVLMPVCCSALQAACFLTAAGSLMFDQTVFVVCVYCNSSMRALLWL